jgi:hypothetical protein
MGIRSDIVLNADGTGKLHLEYRVSRQLEAIGALDGNAGRPVLPTGRADFERSLRRLEGLSLDSYSSGTEGGDLVQRAVISFSRLENILPLLDSGGAGLRQEGDRRVLSLRFKSAENPDPRLLSLAEQAAQGYALAFSLSAPGGVELRLRGDREGLALEENGGKAGFSLALSRLFRPGGDLELDFVF